LLPPLILTLVWGRVGALRIEREGLPVALALGALVAFALTALCTAEYSDYSVLQFLGAYLAPLLLYLTFQSLTLDTRSLLGVWDVLTLAALVPLLRGLLAYYQVFGIPSPLDLLVSRYDLVRMDPYMVATFGNTGNTAALLTLLLPPWLLAALYRGVGPLRRAFYWCAVLVALAHIAIVQSRTLFLVLLVALPFGLYVVRLRRRAIALIVLIVVLVGAAVFTAGEVRDRFADLTVGALSGSADDQSVSERVEAMQIGLKMIRGSVLLGVGVGNSITEHPYTSSHQYWINQGVELGIGGLLAAVGLSLAVLVRFLKGLLRARRGPEEFFRFLALVGPASFMLYGCIANMAWSATYVDVWSGLFGTMLGLADARWAPAGAATTVRSTR